MEINSTLLIQCIHFVIAWIVLKKILLKPALCIIQEEHEERRVLVEAVKTKESSVQAHEQAKLDCIRQYQHVFSHQAPRISKYRELFFFEVVNRIPIVEPLNKKTIATTVDTMSSRLVQQLKQVRV